MDASMIFLQHLQVSTQVSTQTAPAFLSRCCKQRTVTRRTSCGPPHLGYPWPDVASKNLKKSKITTMFVIEFVFFSDLFGGATIYLVGFMWFHHSISGGPPMSILLFFFIPHLRRIQIMVSALRNGSTTISRWESKI